MAKPETVVVKLSDADRRLVRELISAIRGGDSSDEPKQDGPKRLVEGAGGGGGVRKYTSGGFVSGPPEVIIESGGKRPYVDADGRTRYHY